MDSLHEKWRPVVGFEGEYDVSNLGRVRSLPRVIVRRDGVRLKVKGRMLAPRLAKCGGYHRVGLVGESEDYIHRLVLEAFVGPCPPDHSCCHDNGDPTDNHLSNLRWGTQGDNESDKVRHGRSNRGERCSMAKLTASQARYALEANAPAHDVARLLSVTDETIRRIRRGETWKDLKATCEAAR